MEKPVLAVDLEFAHADRNAKSGEGSDWVIVAIIQASTFKTDYIFDCYNLREEIRTQDHPESLRSIFASPNITKVMHGSDTDIKYLVADLNIATINLFDTARAFNFIQRLAPKAAFESGTILVNKHVNLMSLENLAKIFLNLEMDKYFQVADWRVRPLMSGMLEYARNDSHYLLALYFMLIKLMARDSFNSQDEIKLPLTLLK